MKTFIVAATVMLVLRAYSLAPPAQWQSLSNGIYDGGLWKSLVIAPNAQTSNQFFRLKLT